MNRYLIKTKKNQDKFESDIVIPQSSVTDSVAKIWHIESKVMISFPEKNSSFDGIMKTLSFIKKNNVWVKDINYITGSSSDRAAEAGHILLESGFQIKVEDKSVRAIAINGRYKPVCERWITKKASGKYSGWFAIELNSDEDELRKSALTITGTRIDNMDIVVPVNRYDEVMDFAEIHGFKFSPGAKFIIRQAKRENHNLMKMENENKDTIKRKPAKLTIPSEVKIDDELKD